MYHILFFSMALAGELCQAGHVNKTTAYLLYSLARAIERYYSEKPRLRIDNPSLADRKRSSSTCVSKTRGNRWVS
jgi:hypothetical protein